MPFQVGAQTTAQDAATRYTAAAASAGAQWSKKTLMPRVNPIDAAKAASARWLGNINAAGEAGYVAGLNRVDQNAMANTIATQGPALYNAGVTAKAYKYAAAMTKVLPVIRQVVSGLPARGDIEANIARAGAFQRAMHATKGQNRAQ